MTDRRTVALVIALLGAIALVGLAGTIWLISRGTDAASVAIVSGLTGTSVGGLVGMLASTKSSPEPPPFPGAMQ